MACNHKEVFNKLILFLRGAEKVETRKERK